MKIAFRTDASLQIGSGHVMRCLTLADALKAKGAACHFICRAHPGHLLDTISARGHTVTALPTLQDTSTSTSTSTSAMADAEALGQEPVHAKWLGCDWQMDAQQTSAELASWQPDWLVMDHYALDQRWEVALKPCYQKLMVIDDLADRTHSCDLLLDQNLGRLPEDYAGLLPPNCQLLIGPQYALLRPEFVRLRDYSLQRRANAHPPTINQLLITMGGVDLANATGQVLQALNGCSLPEDCKITVVMGAKAPWLSQVRHVASQMSWTTEVVVNVDDMAQRMVDSDLAIGAAGSTTWERCCLGLPTLMVVLADNQRLGANALTSAGAALLLNFQLEMAPVLRTTVESLCDGSSLQKMSEAASQITDGNGLRQVMQTMEAWDD